jgi:hypothetical protein
MISITSPKNVTISQKPTLISLFFDWAERQNDHRLMWLAAALSLHGCFITPFTVMTVMTTTQNFALLMLATGAMAISLVTNLAALPTKITVPAFILSLIIDVAIVIASLAAVL